MPETTTARTPAQRKQDTLRRFETDVDCWVATADAAEGTPYLVPLSHWWDGETLLLATTRTNPTAVNLHDTGEVRLAFGHTRDVVLVHGTAETIERDALPHPEAEAFAAHTGFAPHTLKGYAYYRVRPTAIQAWREVNELSGRDLMRDGEWLV